MHYAHMQETVAVISSERLAQEELTVLLELPQIGTPSRRENAVQFTLTLDKPRLAPALCTTPSVQASFIDIKCINKQTQDVASKHRVRRDFSFYYCYVMLMGLINHAYDTLLDKLSLQKNTLLPEVTYIFTTVVL